MIARSPENLDESTKVNCAVCDAPNVSTQSYCSRCLTPMELSRLAVTRGTPARFLSVLGASAAGKTVYLGFLLDMLSKGTAGLRGLPNGSFSVAVQQQTMTALQNRYFPQKTPSEADHWQWVHCEVSRDRKGKDYVDLVTPDVAGEAIALELEQPGSFPTIRSVVRKSAGHMLLLDSLRVRDTGREEDFFGMKLASYLTNIHGEAGPRKRGKLAVPIAVVLTKADSCPEARSNPLEFAAANLPGLKQYCERNFAHYHLFATGVVGSMVTVSNDLGSTMRIPLHVEPNGVLEPLQWLMTQL